LQWHSALLSKRKKLTALRSDINELINRSCDRWSAFQTSAWSAHFAPNKLLRIRIR